MGDGRREGVAVGGGEAPKVRVKLVVKEPTPCRPTERQISATERSVLRSRAAARSSRRVSR